MALDFDLGAIESVEFGVGLENGGPSVFVLVPIDADAQEAIQEMVRDTWSAMTRETDDPELYDPAEKHGGVEYLYLPLDDEHAERMKELHEAVNLPTDSRILSDPGHVYSYFAQLTDKDGKRLTALRRATQFKGVLKSRLLRVTTDALKLVEDQVFRLDHDFDVMVDSNAVHILRPSGFEFAGQLQQAVLGAVKSNLAVIQADLPFVKFESIEAYASNHPRAARYLASIRKQGTSNISRKALKTHCQATGVDVVVKSGELTVEAGHELAFLEVLDRRRYEITLVEDAPERFKASSRSRIVT